MKVIWSSKIDKIPRIGYPLHEFGIHNWALKKLEALKALDKLLELQIPILGGDVYKIVEETIQLSYDNWYSDKLPEDSPSDFVNRSIRETRSYIEKYRISDHEKVFFAFVPDV